MADISVRLIRWFLERGLNLESGPSVHHVAAPLSGTRCRDTSALPPLPADSSEMRWRQISSLRPTHELLRTLGKAQVDRLTHLKSLHFHFISFHYCCRTWLWWSTLSCEMNEWHHHWSMLSSLGSSVYYWWSQHWTLKKDVPVSNLTFIARFDAAGSQLQSARQH